MRSSTWWLSSASAITRPAKKAPKAIDNPAQAVTSAVPSASVTIARTKRSGAPARATRVNTQGTARAPITSVPTRMAIAFNSARPSDATSPSVGPLNAGSTTIIGTTLRSCTIRIPSAMRPWGAASSPRSLSRRMTTTVLDRATRAPKKTTARPLSPMSTARPAPTAMLATICTRPPNRATRPTLSRVDSDTSTPRANIKNATPMSASTSIWCRSPTGPGVKSLISTPPRK